MNELITTGKEMKGVGNLSEHQQFLLKRINNLALSLMPEFEERSQAINAALLDDKSLMQLLFTTSLEHDTRVEEHELRKVRRRRENMVKFYEQLKEMGGTIKVNDVAEILGITRQAVHARVKKNKLLAFKQNSDYIFPAFQFTDKGLLPGFEEIMDAFDEDTHPVLRLNLFRAPIRVNDDSTAKTPIQIMEDGAKPEELFFAKRAARQLEKHVAT